MDIFDSQYNEYAGGGDAPVISDMTSLSANAVTHAGTSDGYYNYRNSEIGLGLPPIQPTSSIRTSVASNHAGYGAFQTEKSTPTTAVPDKRKSRLPGSNLRHEVASTASEYSEQSPVEDITSKPYQSPYHNSIYASRSDTSSVGTAH